MIVRGERAKLHIPDPGVLVAAAPITEVSAGKVIANARCPLEGGGCAALYVFVHRGSDLPVNPQWAALLVDVTISNRSENGGDGVIPFDLSTGGRVTLPAAEVVSVSARLRGTGGPTVFADFLLQWEQAPSGVQGRVSGDRIVLGAAGTAGPIAVPSMCREVFWVSTVPATLATATSRVLSADGLVLHETTGGANRLPLTHGAAKVELVAGAAGTFAPIFESYLA